MRSFWKGPTIFTITMNKNEKIKILNRESIIFPSFVGKIFLVKNGTNLLKKVEVSEEMVGLKIGEFVFTKKIY